MAASRGKDYIDRLRSRRPHVRVDGDLVQDNVPDHPAFAGVVSTYAELFDMQYEPGKAEVLTYSSPTTGEPVSASFLPPTEPEHLVQRREAATLWANHSFGSMGRTGDYLNAALTALASAESWFAAADPSFGENVRRYYEHVRENDLLTTHTLIPPQSNRSVSAAEQGGGRLAAHVVSEDDNGIVVRGARMLATIAPIADEILVFPSTVLRGTPEDGPYSYAFAVPTDTPGLRLICRRPLHGGGNSFDEPMASRFEEMDAIVVFDDVHVPWERVFLLGHPEKCNGFYTETGATTLMTHQVVTRTTAKSAFFAALLQEMAAAIGIDGFSHIQEDITEVLVAAELGRSVLLASEAGARRNEHGLLLPAWEPLNAARNWYPRISQRFPAIVRKFGASGLMGLPARDDVFGGAADDVERYLQSKNLAGPDRVRLFRLAFDASVSGFAGRQALYEQYFFGDPVRMAGAYVSSTDNSAARQRITEFLARP